MGGFLGPMGEAPVERQERAAEDDVHGHEVQQEGQLQQPPQEHGRRRLRKGVGQGDHGHHGFSSVSGASPAGGAEAESAPRYWASARRSSSVPEKGGISSLTCGSRPMRS